MPADGALPIRHATPSQRCYPCGMRTTARVTLVVLALILAAPSPAQEHRRLVAASNVRLRVEPSEEVRIITTLPLGTEVAEIATNLDRTWVKVRTSDTVEGWMRDGLSRRVPAGQDARIAQDIIRERLARQEDGFRSWVELEDFINRMRTSLPDREWEARFALYRLKAIARAAEAGSYTRGATAQAFAAWRERHADALTFHGPGAEWMLRRDVILADHDRYTTEIAGDEIAWFAVTNGLPGECEGFVLCYLTSDDLLRGEYLRRQPSGIFVERALRDLRHRITEYRDMAARPDLLDPARECAEFIATLDRVRAAVRGVDIARRDIPLQRDQTLDVLNTLRSAAVGCPGTDRR